ncbi:MAG: DUF1194 domain-containing protein [Gemmataceae bacterium]
MAVAVVAIALCAQGQARAALVPVGLELSLLVDVSGSVSSTEFALQRGGYVNAFQNATIQNLITNTPGGIAVNFIYWSGPTEHTEAVGWTHVYDAATANAFAALVALTPRPYSGNTAPGSAINYAAPLFNSNDYDGARKVIDVSGDGAQNAGDNTAAARDAALAGGINTINGLPILGETGLLAWYQNNIQGGTGSFTEPAASFADFADAVNKKLFREISGVPEPGSLALLAIGACGLAGYARRRKANAAPEQVA